MFPYTHALIKVREKTCRTGAVGGESALELSSAPMRAVSAYPHPSGLRVNRQNNSAASARFLQLYYRYYRCAVWVELFGVYRVSAPAYLGCHACQQFFRTLIDEYGLIAMHSHSIFGNPLLDLYYVLIIVLLYDILYALQYDVDLYLTYSNCIIQLPYGTRGPRVEISYLIRLSAVPTIWVREGSSIYPILW